MTSTWLSPASLAMNGPGEHAMGATMIVRVMPHSRFLVGLIRSRSRWRNPTVRVCVRETLATHWFRCNQQGLKHDREDLKVEMVALAGSLLPENIEVVMDSRPRAVVPVSAL